MPFQRSLELGSFSHGEEELSSQSIKSLTEMFLSMFQWYPLVVYRLFSSYILESGQIHTPSHLLLLDHQFYGLNAYCCLLHTDES
ncbi:hypothetical protein PROFUN_13606 [Planoprotostelium fungivorum]|uniref:Uncharacterized protein n=1 Tax=Planoprotostelium fungivorum TaxID=1890364 RepID=A0A2P6N3K9_9EUKA|nr:hypothetical protein PROFUN_13606 [Planoprotostelium fungivorum]